MPYIKAVIFTIFCVIASILVSWGLAEFLMNSFPPEAFVIAVVVPVIIAGPLSVYIMRQQQKIDIAQRNLMAAMIDLEALHKQTEKRARTDQMTGAWNREYFISQISKNNRDGGQGTFLMIDADHFKSINDTWGHQAGDAALIAIVNAIKEAVRHGDLVGRLGGEEFGVFFPSTSLQEALLIAERVRVCVEEIDFEPVEGKSRNLTISLGVAELKKGRAVSDLIKLADDLLYRAKENGRNRICSEADVKGLRAKAA